MNVDHEQYTASPEDAKLLYVGCTHALHLSSASCKEAFAFGSATIRIIGNAEREGVGQPVKSNTQLPGDLHCGFANIIGFMLMRYDKSLARRNRFRVPEKRSFAIAVLGGAFGSWLGMSVFRHKTRHRVFTIGIPLLLVLNIACVYMSNTMSHVRQHGHGDCSSCSRCRRSACTRSSRTSRICPNDLKIVRTYERIQQAFPGSQTPAVLVVKAVRESTRRRCGAPTSSSDSGRLRQASCSLLSP